MSRRQIVERFACPVVLLVVTVVCTFARLRGSGGGLAFYDDDFFYYLKVALNLAGGHGSTFDGIHSTNGYQPLWLLVLTGIAKVAPPAGVFFAVMCLICVSTMATYYFAAGCFYRLGQNRLPAALVATALAFSTQHLIHGGMEVLLTIPLAYGLCWFRTRPDFSWNARNAVLYGLLASLVVLSRLDSVLFMTTLFALELFWLARVERATIPRLLLAGLVTAIPLSAYAAINLKVFGTLGPVSGYAKQLRIHHTLNAVPVKSLLFILPAFPRVLIVGPTILMVLIAVWLLMFRGWGSLPVAYRPIASALMLFPIIHFLALSYLSDWVLFQWYLYSLLLAELGACLVLFSREWKLAASTALAVQVAAALVLLAVVLPYTRSRLRTGQHPETLVAHIYDGSVNIEKFSESHPGIYAMGDRAGTPGYLLKYPVIQVEGLVMDAGYLDNIRRERTLNEVLKDYGVTYLVATNPVAEGNCYHVREPRQAGLDSHVMNGVFCQAPVDHFVLGDTETDIFAVSSGAKSDGDSTMGGK